jgi:hypothetical protein
MLFGSNLTEIYIIESKIEKLDKQSFATELSQHF